MTSTSQADRDRAYALYQRFGAALEADHAGQYVAIAPNGQTVMGDTHLDAALKSVSMLGPGAFIFKIGEAVVGRWR